MKEPEVTDVYNLDLTALRRHYFQCVAMLMPSMGEELLLSSSLKCNEDKGKWYYERFIYPTVAIAIQKGIEMDQIDTMIDAAYNDSTSNYLMGKRFQDAVEAYNG